MGPAMRLHRSLSTFVTTATASTIFLVLSCVCTAPTRAEGALGGSALPLQTWMGHTTLDKALAKCPSCKVFTIISHRRSGTHRALNAIAEVLEPGELVFKANHVTVEELDQPCLAWLTQHTTLVMPYRPLLDVVTSMFYYQRNFTTVTLNTAYVQKVAVSWARQLMCWRQFNTCDVPFGECAAGRCLPGRTRRRIVNSSVLLRAGGKDRRSFELDDDLKQAAQSAALEELTRGCEQR